MGQKLVCPHCNQGIDISVSKKKETPVKPIKEKKPDCPMTREQLKRWCDKSDRPYIRIIGEWAEATEANLTMKSQWEVYISKNVRVAKELSNFSEEQIQSAFSTVEEERKKLGYTPALSTLLKKLTK